MLTSQQIDLGSAIPQVASGNAMDLKVQLSDLGPYRTISVFLFEYR